MAVAMPIPVKPRRRWTYKPGLDGLRALAVLAVVAYHYEGGYFPGGYLGVAAFFVLSGYLITGMLRTEFANRGRIDFPAFYARRALRLYPALLVVVAPAVAVATVVGHPGTSAARLYGGGGFSLLYINDFAVAAGHTSGGWFDMTWSLGVEEQFYLLWPLLLAAVLASYASKTVGVYCVAAAVVAGALEWVLVPAVHPGIMYFSPAGNIAPLMLGAALAFAGDYSARMIGGLAVAGAAVVVVLVFAAPGLGSVSSWHGPEQAAVVAVALVILHLARGGFRLLQSRPAVWLGRRSYGVYLIHEPVHVALWRTVGPHANIDAAIGVPASIALAALSYRFVEQPFLRRKARFARTTGRATPIAGGLR